MRMWSGPYSFTLIYARVADTEMISTFVQYENKINV